MISEPKPTTYNLNSLDFITDEDFNPTVHGKPVAGRRFDPAASSPKKPTEPNSALKPNTTPDAPLTRVSRWITRGIHFLVLVSLVSFVVLQLARAATSDQRAAIVKLVAPNLCQITVPVDGVFTAVKHLPKGTQVEKGQLLGYLTSVVYNREVEAVRSEITELRRRKLVMQGIENASEEQLLAVTQRMGLLKSRLLSLVASNEMFQIRSTVDGTIEHSLSGSKSVIGNDSVAQICEQGDDLLLEIEAPLDVLHRMLKENSVVTRFPTQDGDVSIAAMPIAGSLKSIEKTAGREQGLWGIVQCRPFSLPSDLATPGALGRL